MDDHRIIITASFVACAALGLCLVGAPAAWAYRCGTYIGGTYDGSCVASGQNAQTGGSYLTSADPLVLNPSSLPTFKTAAGLETLYSIQPGDGGSLNVSLIKGLDGVGLGATTVNERSFFNVPVQDIFWGTTFETAARGYGNDLFEPTSVQEAVAFGLPLGALKKYLVPTMGLSLRHSLVGGGTTLGYGFSFNSKLISIGLGGYADNKTAALPEVRYGTFTFGFKIPYLQLEYTALRIRTTDYNQVAKFYSARIYRGQLSVSAAKRSFLRGNGQRQNHVALAGHYQFSPKFSAGYFYGYEPDAHTLSAEVRF